MKPTYLGILRDARTGRVYVTHEINGLLSRGREAPTPCVRCVAAQKRAYLDEGAAVANTIRTYPCTDPTHRGIYS